MPTVLDTYSDPHLDAFLAEYGHHGSILPKIAGSYRGKTLVVCGDAACIWQDLEALGCRKDRGRGCVEHTDYHFMTVNKIVEVFPGNIEHAYSNGPADLKAFIAARRPEYKKEFEGPRYTHSCNAGAAYRWPFGGHGTSGLNAILVGIGLGYNQVIGCGIPLDDSHHNGEPPWRKCQFSRETAGNVNTGMDSHWKAAMKLAFNGRVSSMSGRTRNWLGAPNV